MDLGGRFGKLWERLLGREYHEPTAAPPPPVRRSNQRKGIARDPTGARAIDSIDPPAKGELRLTVEGLVDEADPTGRQHAGFDPYSSDGGFAKPRSWEDVPRK
jgi:hypothetical protein